MEIIVKINSVQEIDKLAGNPVFKDTPLEIVYDNEDVRFDIAPPKGIALIDLLKVLGNIEYAFNKIENLAKVVYKDETLELYFGELPEDKKKEKPIAEVLEDFENLDEDFDLDKEEKEELVIKRFTECPFTGISDVLRAMSTFDYDVSEIKYDAFMKLHKKVQKASRWLKAAKNLNIPHKVVELAKMPTQKSAKELVKQAQKESVAIVGSYQDGYEQAVLVALPNGMTLKADIPVSVVLKYLARGK